MHDSGRWRGLGAARSCVPLLALWPWLCLPASAAAHDFWVQPDSYWLAPQAGTSLTLQVGHGPDRQRSPIPLRRITRFDSVGPNGLAIGLRNFLHPGLGSEDGEFRLEAPGTYVLVLETDDRARSFLPALRFNDYVMAEGLAPALELRQRTRRMDADGSEAYSRETKTIVQVGPADSGSSEQVTKPLGLLLEIIPEASPYATPPAAKLPVKVIYRGSPLAGALVKLTELEHDAAPFESHVTDDTGRARFTMPTRGSWLLNVVWTRPSTGEIDFETTFSSLSFGFPADRP